MWILPRRVLLKRDVLGRRGGFRKNFDGSETRITCRPYHSGPERRKLQLAAQRPPHMARCEPVRLMLETMREKRKAKRKKQNQKAIGNQLAWTQRVIGD